jgi:acyl-CoA thioesterase-1
LVPALAGAQTERPIRWACIGNSITAGPSPTDAYSAKLQKLLGPGFIVQNDGVSGRTLMRNGDVPYWTQGKLDSVFKFQPDIISIKLGTNDSKPVNWDAHKGEFEKDLSDLVDTLAAMPSKPKIWLVIPCPAFADQTGPGGIRGTVIKNEIIPLIKKVAAAKNLNTIDVYTPMLTHQAFFADNVHPNAEGHDTIASIFYRTFLSKATKIACIGNSITEYAFGTPGTVPVDAYSIRLNMLLGRDYWVENDGKSGAYMMKTGPSPYWNMGRLPFVFALKPNIITIKLGTNDARAQYWNKNEYLADYRLMIDSLAKISPKPKIWLLLPCPAWMRNGAWPFQGINDSLIVSQVIPSIKQIAQEKGLEFIDLHTPMAAHEALVPDGVHPNAEGQDTLAHLIYRALTKPTVAIAPATAPAMAYPETNLRGGILYVTYPGQVSGSLRLYAPDGSLKASAPLLSGEVSRLSLSGMAPGHYFLMVETPHGRAAKGLLVEAGRAK